jgi:hypothetical protein
MNKSAIGIFHLPDKILFIFVPKLNNADVLYSLMDVNKWFDKMLCTPQSIEFYNEETLTENGILNKS